MSAKRQNSDPGALATTTALAVYLATIVPTARREIRRWRHRALGIRDPDLRATALETLEDEHLNAEAAAVFALLAPCRARRDVARLLVSWQLMYDYLDTLTEQPSPEPLRDSLQLHRALQDSFLPSPRPEASYFAHHPSDDGGYLAELATTCHGRFARLPAATAVAHIAATEAHHCGNAQSHTHAAMLTGSQTALKRWAQANARDARLQWWETAAGGISSLAVLALIATAACPTTTARSARRTAMAYQPWTCALSTLLDSIVDLDADDRSGNASYASYYPDDAAAASAMSSMVLECFRIARELPNAPTHITIHSGLVAFYLSANGGTSSRFLSASTAVVGELGELLQPTLGMLRARRRLSRAMA